MIDINSISNMTDNEINEDVELREKLIKELTSTHYLHINGYTSLNDSPTVTLFSIYKIMRDME